MSSTLTDSVSENAAPEPARRSTVLLLSALVVGVLGLVAAVLVPLAPVLADDTTVTWPEAGRAPESTTAFFVPYEPVSVRVRVPCEVVRSGQLREGPATLVSSHMPGQPAEGFAVTTSGDQVLVLLGGHEVFRGPTSVRDCAVAVDADAAGSRVQIGDHTLTSPERVEEIVAFTTDLPPAQANGLQVVARTSNWFESTPSPAKYGLMTAYFVLAVLALALLAIESRRRNQLAERSPVSRVRKSPLRGLVDLVVLGVLGVWAVLGPVTADDSFAAMTVRNGLLNGDVSNYYRWENASEAPFTLAQYVLEPVASISMSPLAMRVPSVVAGLLTWWLLSRGALNVLLPAQARRLGARALAAVIFLAWWMPYCLGVRPEAFAALGVTAVLACVLRATARTDGSGLTMLGLGALAAGLSIAVTPAGIIALAPILVMAPHILRTLKGPDRSWIASWVALGGCLASAGVVAMFADQSWFGVRAANELHRFYGPNVPWFQEIKRYEYLLGFDLQGDVGRRTPVLLTIAVLVCATLLLTRGARQLPGMRLAYVPGGCFVVGLALLWLTPSKWTHYFGVLTGLGAAALTCSVMLLVVIARQSNPVRPVLLISLFGTVLTVLAASLAFAGKNNWFLYSQFGVPWGTQPVRPFNSPLLWLALVSALLVVSVALGRRQGAGRMLVRMPAVVASLSITMVVALLLFSFAVAPIRQRDSYSMGEQNIASIGDGSCGIADKIVVMPEVPGSTLRPTTGVDETLGFTAGSGYAPDSAPPETGSDFLWGSLVGGQISTGSLTSRWFALPPLRPDEELAVSVAGRTGDGNRFALEFARSGQPLGERVLDDAYVDSDERPTYPSDRVIEDKPQDRPGWRTLRIDPGDIPAGADQVRMHAVDGTTDPAGWLAVTGPRIRQVVPLPEFLHDRGPSYVDWSMAWSFPCMQGLARVGGGLAEPPTILINAPSGLGFGGSAAYDRGIGGSFAGVRELGNQTEVPTRLLGTDDNPDYAEWGHLMLVDYPVQLDNYAVRTTSQWRWGWQGPG